MKIVYIAHPISGDIENNLKKIVRIVRMINKTEPDIVPFVPYYIDILALDDKIISERNRGIKNDIELIERGFIDEIRLYGIKISQGMWSEISLAKKLGITIYPMTKGTMRDYENYVV